MNWTDEQKRVYSERGNNILVSAAAGSGKTTVLVERLMRCLTDPEDPADIDEFLIVTFTKAAAGQLKDKIREAVAEALEVRENDAHLRRQMTLVNRARITTIDGFCRFVVKNYVSRIDLDPAFRQADKGEIDLLKNEVMQEVLEEAYGDEDPAFAGAFRELSETLAPGKKVSALSEDILKVYQAAMSAPYPGEYYALCRAALEPAAEGESPIWLRETEERLKSLAPMGYALAREIADLNEARADSEKYREVVESYLHFFEEAVAPEGNYDRFFELMQNAPSTNFGTGKTANNPDGDLLKRMRETRNDLVKNVLNKMKDLVPFAPRIIRLYSEKAARPLLVLLEMAERFGAALSEKKRQKNIADFNDVAHYALQILRNDDADHSRTDAARELAQSFREVLIDEYQDSNYLQEELLTAVSRIEDGEDNYFCVGDVKQSIYRFRQARPELFMEKSKSYGQGEKGIRIDLLDNFRSRPEILTCVNRIFEGMMRSEVGGIDYDETHMLKTGQEREVLLDAGGEENVMPEVLVASYSKDTSIDEGVVSDEEEPTGYEAEAIMVGDRIRRLMDGGRIEKTETGESRPLQYRDIVILLRTMKGAADTFIRVLEKQGIPCVSTEQKGFFTAPEVTTLLDLLSVLDNPRQDIRLAAVLHSPIADISAGELAELRSFERDGEKREKEALIDDLIFYREEGPEGSLKDKVTDFLETMADMRFRSSYTPIHELLTEIIRETGYRDYVSAMPGGAKKCLNLDMLIEKAVAYEETSFVGLYNFIRYIRLMEKYDIDADGAKGNEKEDVVRIVSIHKSKGLEYPVVFVCGCGKKINKKESRANLIVHPACGIASDYVDLESRIKYPNLMRTVLADRVNTENMGEELRILYVAMTRARLKLILAGFAAEEKKTGQVNLKKYREIRPDGGAYPAAWIRSAETWLDIILPPVLEAADKEEPFALFDLKEASLLADEDRARGQEGLGRLEAIRSYSPEEVRDPAFRDLIAGRFAYTYPYEERREIPAKLSVSDVKHRLMEDEEAREKFGEKEAMPFIPEFMQDKPAEETLSGAAFGTAVHKVMSLIDFGRPDCAEEAYLRAFIEELAQKGGLTEAEAARINRGRISAFLNSEIGQRMRAAAARGALYRERPFSMRIPASQADRSWSEEESILIQGIIDAYFEEEGRIVLLDYKTDAVKAADELVKRYKVQIELYADALARVYGKEVTERILWSFSLNDMAVLR